MGRIKYINHERVPDFWSNWRVTALAKSQGFDLRKVYVKFAPREYARMNTYNIYARVSYTIHIPSPFSDKRALVCDTLVLNRPRGAHK